MTEYQSDFVCTYHLIDSDEGELLYQKQFLQAFNLERFDDNQINRITDELYKKFGTNELILKLMAQYNNFDNTEIRFRLCFSYGTFHVIHRLLCALIIEEQLTETVVNTLFNKITVE
jgi:hypothetical protein